MKAYAVLPSSYREIYSVDLQKNKKVAVLVNGLALLIALVMVVPVLFAVPFFSTFPLLSESLAELLSVLLKLGVYLVATIVYMILHELVHGIAMKRCGTKKVKYGFTGLYAFAGSEDFYDKKAYIFIALAPILVFLIVFAIAQLMVPSDWFWVIYLLQVTNVSGAAGDLYVTVRFFRLPKDILVKDHGVGMTVYSAIG